MFHCSGCNRNLPDNHGACDDYPNLCDKCANKAYANAQMLLAQTASASQVMQFDAEGRILCRCPDCAIKGTLVPCDDDLKPLDLYCAACGKQAPAVHSKYWHTVPPGWFVGLGYGQPVFACSKQCALSKERGF